MTYSCSDLADDVVGRLLALNLITELDLDDADPHMQAVLCIEKLDYLSSSVTILNRLLEAAINVLPTHGAEPSNAHHPTLPILDAELAGRIKAVLSAEALRDAVYGQGARFMTELLGDSGTLTDIGDEYGTRTLADCMYLLSAIQKGTFIEHIEPSESRILEVVRQLPSWQHWMKFIVQVPQ